MRGDGIYSLKDRVLPLPLVCMGGPKSRCRDSPGEDVDRAAGRAAIRDVPVVLTGRWPSGLSRRRFLSAWRLAGEA